MARKQPFPREADTEPDLRPLDVRLAPTARPPIKENARAKQVDKRSGTRSRRAAPKGDAGGATVDEVVADLSNDPRREEE
jgi:hypothetical protein